MSLIVNDDEDFQLCHFEGFPVELLKKISVMLAALGLKCAFRSKDNSGFLLQPSIFLVYSSSWGSC